MENILNLSKNRKWKTRHYSGRGKKETFVSDMYFVYDLKKEELGEYLNTWFVGDIIHDKNGNILRDDFITLKKVDDETANSLYRRTYNPVSIFILCPTGAKFKFNDKGDRLYNMKAMIHSIDDSSFGIWWKEELFTFYEIAEIRNKLMLWINTKPILNGDEFLKYCINELNADEESVDYN